MRKLGLPDDLNGAGLIARDAVAARQWEAHLGNRHGDGSAWPTPRLLGLQAWRRERWRAHERDRLLLSGEQSQALWRTVIGESALGASLLETQSCAGWALEARTLLAEANVDRRRLAARDSEPDLRAFLRWYDELESRLAGEAWIDDAGIIAALGASEPGPPETVVLLDLEETSQAFESWMHARIREGWRVEHRHSPSVRARARRIALADADEELAVAAQWARGALDRAPEQRIAIVTADLRGRGEALQRLLGSELDGAHPFMLKVGRPARDLPVIGAAIDGLTLVTARASFTTLSRWLRSPFFRENAGSRGAAVRLEAALRSRMTSRLPFRDAWRSGGLREEIERHDPESAAKLGAAVGALERGPRRASAARWAPWLSQALRRLGWPAAGCGVDDAALELWNDALARLAALAPMLGEITFETALAEIEGLLARRPPARRWPLRGVHVLEHVDEIGPGFGAVWITGMTDLAWPERSRSNPLLPHRLQAAAGLPWAGPDDAQRRARASTERLLHRCPQIIVSWPARVFDFAADPSPLIAGLEPTTLAGLGIGRPATRHPRRELETVTDPAPPLQGERIVGGARTLNLQARCPLRAFCETRLGARELDALARGLDRRQQGIAVHRALELYVRAHPSQRAIAANGGPDAIRRAVEQALRELFGAARGPLAALYRLEVERVTALVGALRKLELDRPEFETVALEERGTLRLGGRLIACRADRIDALADGERWIIDYKTGRATNPADWFRERLGDTQLPLYALGNGTALGALAIIGVSGPEPALQVVTAAKEAGWAAATRLPDDATWPEQIRRWRMQLEDLAAEYASGDLRVFLGDTDLADGAYAPLTRIRALVHDRLTGGACG